MSNSVLAVALEAMPVLLLALSVVLLPATIAPALRRQPVRVRARRTRR